jgi:predicted nucleic acid-binding protein
VAKTTNGRRLQAEPVQAGGAAARYIESSALIAARLEGDANARQSIRGEGVRFTSALTLAEFARRVVRVREVGQMDAVRARTVLAWLRHFERNCEIVDITDDVLARVRRPFPVEPLRALDAIHLATIEMRAEDPALVAVVTRDRRVADNARAMGYVVE